MISISLCMIVKNEEKVLDRCLRSLESIVDEIIIIDTGSTDNTKSIARKYTDKIYDFEWNNDFAAARNFSCSKATKDYIYIADADEILDDANQTAFKQLKNVLLPEIEIIQMKYITSSDFNTVYNCKKEYRPKLFKRQRSFNWISPIHETVALEPIIFDSDIEVLHLPESNHSNRDFQTFINAVNNGTRLENYVLLMFCKELFISGSNDDFLSVGDIFETILSKEDRNETCRKNISCVLARVYRLTNNYNEFFKICLKDMALESCAEICVELGEYFFSIDDYDEAILWFTNASSEAPSIIDIHTSGDLPLKKIAECFEKLASRARCDKNYELYDTYCSNSLRYKSAAELWCLPVEL